MYKSFFENHPPLTAALLQPVVRSTDDPEVMIRRGRLLMLALAAGVLGAVGLLARHVGGWSASAPAAALLLGHTFFFQKILEVRPDVPALLLWTVSLLVLLRAASGGRRPWMVTAGALLCLAGLFTPKVIYAAAGATLAAAFAAGQRSPDHRARAAIGTLAFILLGASLVAAAAAAFMARYGILGGFLVDVLQLGRKLRIDDPAWFRWTYLKMTLALNAPTWILAALGIAALWRGRRAAPAGHVHILFWSLGAGLLGLFLIQAPLRQYFLTFLPQVAVLGALGAKALGSWSAARWGRVGADLVLIFILLLATLPAAGSMYRSAPSMERQLAVVRKVIEVTGRDDRVLDCWTGLYLTRLPAYRYFFLNSDVQRLIPPAQLQRDLLTALEDPRVKLVIAGPYFELLPASVHQFVKDKFDPLPQLPFLCLRK
jgi:hypothetical protein